MVIWRFDEVTVVTALLQFHHDVQEARGAAFGAFTQSLVVPGQDPPVHKHISINITVKSNN